MEERKPVTLDDAQFVKHMQCWGHLSAILKQEEWFRQMARNHHLYPTEIEQHALAMEIKCAYHVVSAGLRLLSEPNPGDKGVCVAPSSFAFWQ